MGSIDFGQYAQWLGYGTIALLLLTIIAFVLGWGFRFRLVGVTSFLGVLTFGLFGLGLGLFNHTTVPGALHYTLVYDNGANQTVIALPPQVTESEVEATLRQAGYDLFSAGRIGGADAKLNIRARTVIHPQEGLSQPLYLGELKRSLSNPGEDAWQVALFSDNFKKL